VNFNSLPKGSIDLEELKMNPFKHTYAPIDWAAKRQPATAFSTPDAEERAIADMITRSLGPIANFCEQVFPYDVKEEILTDNAAALSVSQSGVSRKLSYTRRTQRVSVGLVSDYCNADNCEALKEDSKLNGADLFTKALDHADHWDHMARNHFM
jgi:hypothetical protein